MTATITQFRKDLFHLADEALSGEPVAFTYRGVVFHIMPDKKQSKLDKLVGQNVIAEGVDLEQAGREFSAAMEAEWLKKWSEI